MLEAPFADGSSNVFPDDLQQSRLALLTFLSFLYWWHVRDMWHLGLNFIFHDV